MKIGEKMLQKNKNNFSICITVILQIFDNISFTWWCSNAVKVWWDVLLPHYCYLPTECVSKKIVKISLKIS